MLCEGGMTNPDGRGGKFLHSEGFRQATQHYMMGGKGLHPIADSKKEKEPESLKMVMLFQILWTDIVVLLHF